MQRNYSIAIPLSNEYKKTLAPFMKVKGQKDVGEFFRDAISFCLREQGRKPLTRRSCSVSDGYVVLVNEKNGVQSRMEAAILEFRGNADFILKGVRPEEAGLHDIGWAVQSAEKYAEALESLLPLESKMKLLPFLRLRQGIALN